MNELPTLQMLPVAEPRWESLGWGWGWAPPLPTKLHGLSWPWTVRTAHTAAGGKVGISVIIEEKLWFYFVTFRAEI